MEVAIEASHRGHKVDLYEKTDRLGGVFNAAAAMSYKEKDKNLLRWFERELRSTDTVIHLNEEVSDLSKLNADIIVIAVGAKARTLNIPGSEKSVTATDFLEGNTDDADNVVIIGGGLTGCEIAYELALKGKHPSVVEMTENIVGARGICMANSSMLRELLRYQEVPVYLNSQVEEIRDGEAVERTPEGKKVIPADKVVMSVGYTPDRHFAQAAGSRGKDRVFFVGDCDNVGNLKTVIRQAFELVQKISY